MRLALFAFDMHVKPVDLAIPIGEIKLAGSLALPPGACGLVMFAHGSGSSRHSPRNRRVAALLQDRGLATLLFDLLTADEEQIDAADLTLRCDVGMLAQRLVDATDSIVQRGRSLGLPIGYFGSSTGAAAALIAAARRPARIAAVVSRGGRPDLVGRSLAAVRAPTLLIVGADDPAVLQANRAAAARLTAPHRLAVIPGATHLFEEPGTLDEAARLACDWFLQHFTTGQLREAS